MILPDIPDSWLIFALLFVLVILRFYNIDSWTTGTLAALAGYILGNGHGQIIASTTK